jgi:DNA-binding MarR family transcriptional regulator
MTGKNTVAQEHYEMLAEFRYALRKFLRFSEDAAHAAGLTPQQHQAMLAIKGFSGGQISIGELAERLQILHHSAVGLVNRLVAQKYVRRLHGKNDRRRVHLTLTPRGEAVLERLSTTHREQIRRMSPQINRLMESLLQGPPVIEENRAG